MRLAIIHLSDIHIKKQDNFIHDKLDKIALSIQQEITANNIKACLFVISGDIAYSGKAAEYELADKVLKKISEKLKSLNSSLELFYAIVPGNHDCDFENEKQIRQAGVTSIDDANSVDDSIIQVAVSVQDSYREFATKWLSGSPVKIEPLLSKLRLTINGVKTTIYLINSAWISQRKEKRGSLKYPVSQLIESPEESNDDIVIAVMHHPYPWFETRTHKLLRKCLERCVDVIITGHEHDSNSYVQNSSIGTVQFVEGGVLQDSTDPGVSTFNFILADIESKKFRMNQHSYDEKRKEYQKAPLFECNFLRNKNRIHNTFQIAERYQEELQDPGAPFTHPHKEKLTLDDIFVCPNLRQFDIKNIGDPGTRISSANIVRYVQEERCVLISSGDAAGKTTLAKYLFQSFHRLGLVPVIINGRDLRSSEDEKVYATVMRKFSQQYELTSIEHYESLSRGKRVIIVDDYHRIRFNVQARSAIVKRFIDLADIVILFSLTELTIDEILNNPDETSILLPFKQCELLTIDLTQQCQMIEKWYQIGADSELEPRHRRETVVRIQRRVQEVLQRDYMPAYPIVVLIMLQQIETFTKLDTKQASLGHLYDVLAKAKLISLSPNLVDVDLQYTYLAEVAYFMFKKRSFKLNRDQIEQCHNEYLSSYSERFSVDSILDTLSKAQLIIQHQGDYCFKYKYHYFFFAGKYFADNIGDVDIQKQVKLMIHRLYNEDAANIVVFMCYFTKDKFILDSILDVCRGLFSTSKPFELDQDIKKLGPFLFGSQHLSLSETNNPDVNHRAHLAAQQAEADSQASVANQSGAEICIDELDRADDEIAFTEALQTNAAFKTIQILGQILRTYAGSLKGDLKYELTEQCFLLGLRTMAFNLNLHATGRTVFHEGMIKFLSRKKHNMTPSEKDALASRIFVGLIEFFIFILIKHMAESVGSERLMPTYRDIVAKFPSNSVRLIDLAIKLDQLGSFPTRDVELLARELKNNLLPHSILRRLVWEHFHLYRVDFTLQQKCCQLLDISYERVRMLPVPAASTEIKKKL